MKISWEKRNKKQEAKRLKGYQEAVKKQMKKEGK